MHFLNKIVVISKYKFVENDLNCEQVCGDSLQKENDP